MKTTLIALATASMMLAIPVSADADEFGVTMNEDGTCDSTVEFENDGTYLDDRPGAGYPDGTGLFTGGGTWVYEESNGIPGLQIGGAGETEDYVGCANPDTLIF